MRRLLLPLAMVASLLLAACGTSQAETASSPAARAPSPSPPAIFTANTKKHRFAPRIVGSPTVGQLLTTTNGTWTNSPTSFAYQWQRCTSPGTCSNIAAATAGSYTVQLADVGDTIRVIVTATGAGGPLSQTSAETGVVATGTPAGGTVAVTGTATQGQTLTATASGWSNTPTGYAFQWEDCDPSGLQCSNATGTGNSSSGAGTTSTYTLVSADVADTIRAVLTPSNAGGNGNPATATPSLTVLYTTGHYHYIDPGGTDSGNCQTIGSPCKTVAYGASQLTAGDVLYARGGTYSSAQNQIEWCAASVAGGGCSSTNTVTGTASQPVTFSAYPGETPVFDGGSISNDAFIADMIGAQHTTINGLTIQNYPGNGIWMGGNCTGENTGCTIASDHNTISNTTFTNDATFGTTDQFHSIYVSWDNTNNTFYNNTFVGHAGCGMQLGAHTPYPATIAIYNSVFDQQGTGAVNGGGGGPGICETGGSNISVYNNTVLNVNPNDNQVGGNDIDLSSVTTATVRNNIISTPMFFGGTTGLTCDHNMFIKNVSGGSTTPNGTCSSNVSPGTVASSEFVAPGSENFLLLSTSHAVDAGTSSTFAPFDQNDFPRPYGSAVDIGAFEWHP